MKNIEEKAWIAQAVVFHSRTAFGRLVEKYQAQVRRFFLSQTLGDTQLSDDLAQDTFVKAYVNITRFRGEASFSTWLYRIAYNVYYDYVKTLHNTDSIDTYAVMGQAARVADRGLQIDLHKALALLTENERTCIVLQLIEGQPLDTIATVTGMPQGTIKSHLSRGKKKMADYLRNNGYER